MIEQRTCEVCATDYRPRSDNQRFCGAGCREGATYLRGRADAHESERLLVAAGLYRVARSFEASCADAEYAERRAAHEREATIDHARTVLAENQVDGYRLSHDGAEVLIPHSEDGGEGVT